MRPGSLWRLGVPSLYPLSTNESPTRGSYQFQLILPLQVLVFRNFQPLEHEPVMQFSQEQRHELSSWEHTWRFLPCVVVYQEHRGLSAVEHVKVSAHAQQARAVSFPGAIDA